MTYYVDLFSPETYSAFSVSSRSISGFRINQQRTAERINIGDKFVCYMTKTSRWIGVLEVLSKCFVESTPIFYPREDPFIVRFHVRPVVWLDRDHSVPIHSDAVWSSLSFTRSLPKRSLAWTGIVRGSLGRLTDEDGAFLERLLVSRAGSSPEEPMADEDWQRLIRHRVRTVDGQVTVSVPTDSVDDESPTPPVAVSDHLRVQIALAKIGSSMGMKIWIPARDRGQLLVDWPAGRSQLVEILPLNYDETTLKTIEEIDVLWLRGRAIVRAFEVEHSTSIYSGLLRMADLLALQPNMDIRLHIVAPKDRRSKVFQEISRPVFSLLERGPLSARCTYLSYDSISEVGSLQHLSHMTDAVIEEYVEAPK